MCEHPCVPRRVLLAGQSAIVQRRPQGLLLPPTRHNKEQLNAAALPAEEPTASHTSTNRQICLKPKGRSNKSQPTGSNPLRSLPLIQTRRWLAGFTLSLTITVQAALPSEKKNWVPFYTGRAGPGGETSTWTLTKGKKCWNIIRLVWSQCFVKTLVISVLQGLKMWFLDVVFSGFVAVCFLQWQAAPLQDASMELLCVCLTCQRSFWGLKPFLHHIKTVEMVAHSLPAHFMLSFFGVSLCQAPTTDCTHCLCFAEVHCICFYFVGSSIQMFMRKVAIPQCKYPRLQVLHSQLDSRKRAVLSEKCSVTNTMLYFCILAYNSCCIYVYVSVKGIFLLLAVHTKKHCVENIPSVGII